MKSYEHIRSFDVGFCDVDFKDELKPSKVLAYFEEAACSSVEELGYGYSFCKRLGVAFMLTEVRCEFLRPAKLGETAVIKTWPLPPSYVIFGREYRIEDGNGTAIANATSRWCMTDMNCGKILPSKLLLGQDYSTYNTAKALASEGKIPRFKEEEGELKYSMTVANSEYDHNMHVNNTRYADYCFNCFSTDELFRRRLKGFSIAYAKQCREGERLRFFRKDEADGKSVVCGFNDAGEIVVHSEIAFV